MKRLIMALLAGCLSLSAIAVAPQAAHAITCASIMQSPDSLDWDWWDTALDSVQTHTQMADYHWRHYDGVNYTSYSWGRWTAKYTIHTGTVSQHTCDPYP